MVRNILLAFTLVAAAYAHADTVSVIDTRSNQLLPGIPIVEEPEFIAITPDGGTAYFGDAETGKLQVLRVNLPGILIVIDDENQRRVGLRHCSASAGIVNVNVEPFPMVLSSVMRPPSAVASRRQIARPSPVPPY